MRGSLPRRSRQPLELRNRTRSLAIGRAYAVASRIPAAPIAHMRVACNHRLNALSLDVVTRHAAVLLPEVIPREVATRQVTPWNIDNSRLRRTDANRDHVKIIERPERR